MIGRLGERAGAFFQNYKTHFGKCLYLTEPCCFTWPPRWLANRISPEYRNHRWDFPCCAWSTLLTCRRHYPGRSDGIYSLVRFHSLRPSPKPGRVGSYISLFEACSAFTHVMACMLAESPMRPSTPKASAASLPPPQLRLLPGGANQFPGWVTLAADHRLFTAHRFAT